MSLGLLNILPISEVIVAKRKNVNATIKTAKWFLYDVYRIASNYPLEISLFGQIMNDVNDTNIMDAECLTKEKNNKLSVTKKFLSKSTRDDLKGLTLTCGLVVSIKRCNIFFGSNLLLSFIHDKDSISGNIHISRGSKCRKC